MNYSELNKEELKALCKKNALKVSGTNKELALRLEAYDKTKQQTVNFEQGKVVLHQVALTKTGKVIATDIFFLHIKSANLSNYFNFGYFYPLALEESEIYKNENRAKDILSNFEEYIIVGNTPFNRFENADVLIELVLNGIKVTEYENMGLFYIAEPIPVSRVRNIYFKTVIAKAAFISSIKTFPDSFIPNSICKIIPTVNEQATKIDLEKIKLPKNQTLSSWENKLNLFDKILGLFAFMKNTGIFYSERENKFEDYSRGFFGTLTIINPIKHLANYKENTFLRPLIQYRNIEITNAQRAIFKSEIERVYSNKTFDIKTAISMLESSIANEHSQNGELADIKEQIDLFKQLDKLTISYKGLLQKEVLKKNLPALALLFLSKFPNKSRQHTDKQAVRNSFIDNEFGFSMNVAEYILGFLGLYYGYRNMIKEDTNLKFFDKNFEKFSNNTQSIKFKLESYLDRFIVESAFQFAIKQTVLNDSFEFLNWNNEQNETKTLMPPSSFQYNYSDNSFTILGQRILSIQRQERVLNIPRQEKPEDVFEKIVNQYPDKVTSSSYLVAFIKKHLTFDKWVLLDILKKNKGRYPIDELEKIIELDKIRVSKDKSEYK